MLCAPASPVKHEGEHEQHEREPDAWHPDLQKLRPPVTFRGDADAVSANEIDLRDQEGEGHGQQGQGCEHARAALLRGCVHGKAKSDFGR
jgi:hypothetical protein